MTNPIKYLFSVVPDELQIRYAARGDRISIDQWDIGDDANDLWDMSIEYKWHVRRQDIYDFLSAAHNYSVSASSIARYAAIAEFYSIDDRERYQALSFEHFATARSFGDQWETILDGALRYVDDHNRPPSCSWLRSHYRGVSQAPEVAAIDNGTYHLDDVRSIVDRDNHDLDEYGEFVDETTDTVVELTYKQHAMIQGLMRSLRFLKWASQRLPDLGIASVTFEMSVEALELTVAEILRELTKERKPDKI